MEEFGAVLIYNPNGISEVVMDGEYPEKNESKEGDTTMKRYTIDELITMTEEELDALNEAGKIDDDDWMYWHEIHDDIEYMAADFIENELKYWI